MKASDDNLSITHRSLSSKLMSTSIYCNIIETPECERGAEKEMVEYYLLNCELYDEERDALRRKVGAQGMRPSI